MKNNADRAMNISQILVVFILRITLINIIIFLGANCDTKSKIMPTKNDKCDVITKIITLHGINEVSFLLALTVSLRNYYLFPSKLQLFIMSLTLIINHKRHEKWYTCNTNHILQYHIYLPMLSYSIN